MSAQLKASFEKELKNKLQQKASGVQSEEQVLQKSFKYFDLNNNGTVEPEEFAKAIEKIGIMIPTKQDVDALFAIYDEDGSGAISYKEFSSNLFGRPNTAKSQVIAQERTCEQLGNALRDKLVSRGAKGFIGLKRQFKIMDDNGSNSLDKQEFTKAMNDYMLGFNNQEIAKLFDYFDFDNSGAIEFDEFIAAIRGPMPAQRKKVVLSAYNILDKDRNGFVDINDIRGVYDAKNHPAVKQGKKTEEQILQEFLETFETAHAMRNNDAPNHIVTKEEFIEYYNNISASIDDDAYFTLMINNAWGLGDRPAIKQSWSNQTGATTRGQQTSSLFGRDSNKLAAQAVQRTKMEMVAANANEEQLLENLRKRLAARGARGIASIGKKFKIADDNNSKTLDVNEFKKAMHDFRIGMNEKQVTQVYKVFDRDGSGEITYDEFLRTIRGEMNPFRKNIAMKAYKIMDKDGSGLVDINDIRQSYNAKEHPDVKAGKKSEDEILSEFLDTFEDHFADMKGHEDARDGKITKKEWVEYYNNVSMSIDRDDYFELMMNNAWNLDGSKVTKKGWGAEV